MKICSGWKSLKRVLVEKGELERPSSRRISRGKGTATSAGLERKDDLPIVRGKARELMSVKKTI